MQHALPCNNYLIRGILSSRCSMPLRQYLQLFIFASLPLFPLSLQHMLRTLPLFERLAHVAVEVQVQLTDACDDTYTNIYSGEQKWVQSRRQLNKPFKILKASFVWRSHFNFRFINGFFQSAVFLTDFHLAIHTHTLTHTNTHSLAHSFGHESRWKWTDFNRKRAYVFIILF